MKLKLPPPSRIPLVLGVTGHRDPRSQDVEALQRQVHDIFHSLRRKLPHTPLLLISALAEGADQIVAEVALKCHVPVVAVLPMPLDIYKAQMPAVSQQAVDRLLEASSLRIDLPVPAGVTLDDLRNREDARVLCYEALAAYLVEHGQALIALWDGRKSDKRGGTAAVVHAVRFGRLTGSPGEFGPRCGFVYQIVTPRSGSDAPSHSIRTRALGCKPHRPAHAGSSDHHPPLVEDDDFETEGPFTSYNDMLNSFEYFNAAAERLSVRGGVSLNKLVSTPPPAHSFEHRLHLLYAEADAVSFHANSTRKKYLIAILWIAIVGAIVYSIHGEIFIRASFWWWLSFPLFVVFGGIFYYGARRSHVEEQYLDSRALAEALRVQSFWEMACIHEPVKLSAGYEGTGLNWIEAALHNIWMLRAASEHRDCPCPNYPLALEKWVKDQRNWYQRRAQLQSNSVHRRSRNASLAIKGSLLWSTFVMLVIILSQKVPALQHVPWLHPAAEWPYALCHILLIVPALIAAAYRVWVEQAGYEEQSREYRSMAYYFDEAARKLEEHLDSPEIARTILLDLGRKALEENGRWLALHRERPLEVMTAP